MEPDELIKKWGFSQNPFSVSAAEVEGRFKDIDPQSYFLAPPYFGQIVGNLEYPTSSIIYGSRGDGKSFICRSMKKMIMENGKIKIFIIDYMDFSNFKNVNIDNISLDIHLDIILKNGLINLVEELERNPSLVKGFSADKEDILKWFINRYHPKSYLDLDSLKNKLTDLQQTNQDTWFVERELQNVERELQNFIGYISRKISLFRRRTNPNNAFENLKSIDLLRQLRDLVNEIGFKSIYVIIDKLDEDELQRMDYVELSKFIEPMLISLEYLQLENVATKIFLPREIKNILGPKIRSDRIDTISIKWSNRRLCEMLAMRLIAFSNGKINSLKSFVRPEIFDYFESNILYYSANCPRNLIRILKEIVSELCENEPYPELITKLAINNGIRKFYDDKKLEANSDDYIDSLLRSAEEFEGKELYQIPENI